MPVNRSAQGQAELAAALVAFQKEFYETVGHVEKGSVNPFFNSSYADIVSCFTAAVPLATAHGLAVSQDPGTLVVAGPSGVSLQPTLITTVMHTSGEWKEAETVLYLPKQDPQGQGSAITYMRRYAYLAALGLVTDEDDDGNAASPQAPAARPQQQRTATSNPQSSGLKGAVAERAAATKARNSEKDITKGQSSNLFRLFKKLEAEQGWDRDQYSDAIELYGGDGVRDDRKLNFQQASDLIGYLKKIAGEEEVPPPPAEEPSYNHFEDEPF